VVDLESYKDIVGRLFQSGLELFTEQFLETPLSFDIADVSEGTGTCAREYGYVW